MRRTAGVVLAIAFGVGLLGMVEHRLGGDRAHAATAKGSNAARPPPRSLDDIFRLRGEDFLGALAERTSLRADRVGVDELSPSEAAPRRLGARGRGEQRWLRSVLLQLVGRPGPAPSRAARWEQMDRWEPEVEATLDALDTEFHAYPEPLAERMERHCRAHREAFAR